MNKIAKYLKVISIVFVIIAIPYAYIYFKGGQKLEFVTYEIVHGNVKQIVTVNGTVTADFKQELKFQKPGTINTLNVKVGDKVKKGQLLAALDDDLYKIEMTRAKSDIELAQAELNLRNAGSTQEEIVSSEKKIFEAEVALKNTYKKLGNTITANKEKVKIAELELESAQIILDNHQKQYQNILSSADNATEIADKKLKDAYDRIAISIIDMIDVSKASLSFADSVLGVDDLTSNSNYVGLLSVQDPGLLIKAKNLYKSSNTYLARLKEKYDLFADQDFNIDDLEILIDETKNNLYRVKELLDDTYGVLLKTITDGNFSALQLDQLKSTAMIHQGKLAMHLQSLEMSEQEIASLRLNLETVDISNKSNLTSGKNVLDEAKNRLSILKQNLVDLKTQITISEEIDQMEIEMAKIRFDQAKALHQQLISKPREVDVAAIKANMRRAEAIYEQAKTNWENTRLIASMDGIITNVNMEIGENVTGNEIVLSIANEQLQIKADISETDINKIALGNKVALTFDAFSLDHIFEGKVVKIDPAETVIQGVIYYRITVEFVADDAEIRSGMTANLDILTGERADVLIVPPEAIYYQNNQPFVFIVTDQSDQEEQELCIDKKCKQRRFVKIGLEGLESLEIIDGLNSGDRVVLYEKEL